MAEPADKVCNALGVRPRLHSLGLLRGKPSERWCLSPNDDYTPGRPDADRMCASDGTFRSAGQPLTEFVTLYHACRVFWVILSLVIALRAPMSSAPGLGL